MKSEILVKNAREYYSDGMASFKKGNYNSAVVLFFKSVVSLIDLFLLQQIGYTPSSHITRFSITKKNFPKVYDILDRDFPFYQDSYVKSMTKELVEVIKEDAEIMAKETKTHL
ncbi:MAG TPA: hypothetical protein P5277_03870 [Candidatus Paceibacterota bacterium]|nr:hypothetical protein [Candidatus Paceibacterota bacterium]